MSLPAIILFLLFLGGIGYGFYELVKYLDKPTTEPEAEQWGQNVRHDVDPKNW